MATIIFDLDHTLLNTEKLREELAKTLGLSLDEYKDSYTKNFSNNKLSYSFKKHLELLREDDNFSKRPEIKNAEDRFKEKFKEMDRFLFKGAIEFVENEKDNNNEVVLITFGNKEWQEDKINKLNSINEVFDKENIIFEDKNKSESESLKELATRDEIIIVNDNIEETIKMVETIHAERKEKRLSEIIVEVAIIRGKHSRNEIKIEQAKNLGFKIYDKMEDVPNFEKIRYSDEFYKEVSNR